MGGDVVHKAVVNLPLVPPFRFALVEDGVYRGAYPSQINLPFLARLGLRSMISLLPEEPAAYLLQWCEDHDVRNYYERIVPFGTEVRLTHERAAELVQLLVLLERQPVYVHCLDGVRVTGALVMCLRKLQCWAATSLTAEYARFARDGLEALSPPTGHVLSFMHAFKPELEFEHLLPERMPHWLDAALRFGMKPIETRTAAAVADDELNEAGAGSMWHLGIEREWQHHAEAGDSEVMLPVETRGRRCVLSDGLEALAIEGLTIGSARIRTLHENVAHENVTMPLFLTDDATVAVPTK